MHEVWSDAAVDVTLGRRGDPLVPGQALVSLRIVTFSVPRNSRGEKILAWVGVGSDRMAAPVLLVSLPAITVALANTDIGGYPFKRLTSDRSGQLIAQAVGRAAAHELGHYLRERGGHDERGLMRRSYTPRDLVGAWLGPFRLEPQEWPAAHAGIAALARTEHDTV